MCCTSDWMIGARPRRTGQRTDRNPILFDSTPFARGARPLAVSWPIADPVTADDGPASRYNVPVTVPADQGTVFRHTDFLRSIAGAGWICPDLPSPPGRSPGGGHFVSGRPAPGWPGRYLISPGVASVPDPDSRAVSPPASGQRGPSGLIRIRGARQHNLQNIDVDLPQGRLVVLTGPSGSGKSSLAISTVFAEGQRQYIETLATWARQFVDEFPRPEFDSIEGLLPTLCIDQAGSHNSPRSTVGTVTEIHDYLRVLMARAADIHCHRCGSPIRQSSPQRIVEWVEALPEGTRAMILAPMVRGRRGKHEDVFESIRQAGLLRVSVDGQIMEVDSIGQLDSRRNHTIEAVTDRIGVRPGMSERIGEGVDLALRLAGGACRVRYQSRGNGEGESAAWQEALFSTRFACPDCDVAYVELEPRNFSFNSPYGACPECQGLGWLEQFDPDRLIPDKTRSVADGAIVVWRDLPAARRRKQLGLLMPFFSASNLDAGTPLDQYPVAALTRLMQGDGQDQAGSWPGLLQLLESELATTLSGQQQETLEACRDLIPCSACDGSRLGPQARSASLEGKTIIDINQATLADALEFLERLQLPEDRVQIGQPLIDEICRRLRFLCHVGLDYLALERPADSLSGGEYQRVRLASSIGSGLSNVCYVLDEPTVGLHPRDNDRLIESIRALIGGGNSVIVVEHDADMIRAADHVVDMGPGAGQFGGEIMFQGSPAQLLKDPASATAGYLSGRQRVADPDRPRRAARDDHFVELSGATGHNLQDLTVRFPLGLLVAVSGVSGSGKSTLVQDTLAPIVARHLGQVAPRPAACGPLTVAGQLDHLVPVNQRPIGRSPRSNPATYSGIMLELRKLLASTREARALGFGASRFSFNSGQGRCPGCQGLGQKRIEMNFLPDLYQTCPECQGRRYNRQTLEVRYRGRNIAEMLEMPIREGVAFFENVPRIHDMIGALDDVGLGYMTLGQASTTLSGGEAQRVKLATELGRRRAGHTLYLLDEPTSGLHFQDVGRLLTVLHRLVDQGNSVLVIEHHPDLIAAADWVIELGPGGGRAGGRLVRSGPVDQAGPPSR